MAVIILEVSTRYNYIFIDKFLSVTLVVFFSQVFLVFFQEHLEVMLSRSCSASRAAAEAVRQRPASAPSV